MGREITDEDRRMKKGCEMDWKVAERGRKVG